MWGRITNVLDKVIFNPRKTDRYSPVVVWIKEEYFVSEFPEEKGLPLESLSLLFLYMVAIIPYAVIMMTRGFEPLLVLQQTAVLLILGLILGSAGLTFGFINLLILSFFNLSGSLATASSNLWLNTTSLTYLLIVLFLLLPPHILPNLAKRKSIWLGWTLVYSFLIGFGGFAVNVSRGHLLEAYITASIVFGSLAALTPSFARINGKREIKPAIGWIAGILFGLSSIALSWQLYSLLFPPREPAWFNVLVHIAITILLCVFHIIVIASMLGIDDHVKGESFILPARRWLLFLGFLFIALTTQIVEAAILGSFLVIILFSLTFSNLPKLLEPLSLNKKITSILFSAFVALIVATTVLYNGFGAMTSFLKISLPPDIASSPATIFIAAALVFTLSGWHWSTIVTAVAAGISIWLFTELPTGVTIWPIIFALIGAVIVGSFRILLWPILSLLMIFQSRQIASLENLDNTAYLPALSLLETYCWPYPLGLKQILQSLARHGYPDSYFTRNALKRKYEKVRVEMISDNILAASSLAEISMAKSNLMPPSLLKPIDEIRQIESKKRLGTEKVRQYATILEDLQKTIKEGPKQFGDPKITSEEIQSLEKLVEIIYRELRSGIVEYWELYNTLSQITVLENKPEEQDRSEQAQIIAATAFYLAQIQNLDKEIRSIKLPRSLVSPKERTTYNILLAIQPRLERFEQGLDYQERARLLAEIQRTFTVEMPDTWLTIDPKNDNLVKQDNPWASLTKAAEHYLSELVHLNNAYIQWVTNEIAQVLTSVESIESLPALAQKTERLIRFGEQYGPMLDSTILYLERISKEAASALAFPTGYNRRLGLQATLDRITELHQQLALRFVSEAMSIIVPLRKIGEMLHAELFAVSDDSANVFRNPYVTGNPLKLQSQLFKGREDLAQKIANLLESQSRPTLVVHGPRRMGKTSFLLQLPRLLPSYLPVYLDMQSAGAQGSDVEFAYAMARAIYLQIGRSNRLTKPSLADFKDYPFTILTDWLEEIKPLFSNRTMLFVIDEFELIGRALKEGKLSINVLDYLRNMMQHNDNILLMFAGVQTIEALGPNPSSYFISAYPVEISYLHPKEAEELIRNPDPKAGKMPDYDGDVVAQILEMTLCQPLLVQFICSEIVNQANEQNLRIIHIDTLQAAIKRVLNATLYFDNIWVDAGQEGQALLIELAHGPKPLAELAFSEETIADLQHRRVIRLLPDDRYEIEIPLVQAWVKRKTTPAM